MKKLILNSFNKNLLLILEHTTVAELKAVINAILIPLILMVSMKSVLAYILWIAFVSFIYGFLKKYTENGRVFFQYLKVLLALLAGAFLFTFLLVVV